MKYYNNMHSYSQLVLLSWGYTTDPPANYMQFVSRILVIENNSIKKTCNNFIYIY